MSSPRVLIIDDEADLRELLEITLVKMGLDIDSAESLEQARALFRQNEYDLVLTDMRLPDGMGIELVKEISASHRITPVAVITAFGSADNAVAALKAGAFDYLTKPIGLDQLRAMVQSALRLMPAEASGQRGRQPGGTGQMRLLGESSAMQQVRTQIVRLARSMAPVAITGESGSGKELAARDIHSQGMRADKPFIAVNCGAIPEALMEAEFFGYRKGAFTGATEDRGGFFQAASGGTLMLDEVADLPLAMQVKLLRAIQERRVRKVGSTVEEPVDVRLISATHQNLAECVEKGRFRQDLYYRLNVIELRLPPLRERKEDLALLVGTILQRFAHPASAPGVSAEALQALAGYSFPGNVRELENILERAMAFADHGVIEAENLLLKKSPHDQPEAGQDTSDQRPPLSPPTLQPVLPSGVISTSTSVPASVGPPAEETIRPGLSSAAQNEEGRTSVSPTWLLESGALPSSLPDYLDEIEREVIRRALGKTRFNRTQAAEILGISFRQLRYRMQRLGIHDPE